MRRELRLQAHDTLQTAASTRPPRERRSEDEETDPRRPAATAGTLPGIEIDQAVLECHLGGKIAQRSRAVLQSHADLERIYTPGVAQVASAIRASEDEAWSLTGIGKSVGIFTNGTRVLSLGDIGPLASLPVMEGKAVLYDQLVGLSATPILVDATDPASFVEAVSRVAGSFAAIHLEDIRSPECFEIEDRLSHRLDKPVLHDDQHGTAVVVLAAAINACRFAGRDLREARVAQVGLGAAGSAIARLLRHHGVGDLLVSDPSPEAVFRVNGLGARPVSLAVAAQEADVLILATARPGLLDGSAVRPGQVILALSNPKAEIDPLLALAKGAAFAADGRTINNALAFPGLFHGVLRARARRISPKMLLAAARTLSAAASQDALVPDVLDRNVHLAVSDAVLRVAREENLCNTLRLSRRPAHSL